MPDSTQTDAYLALSESAAVVIKVSLMTSFVGNLVLAGPLNLLWGFVNSLQIVTHFPLINVMMPSNAYQLLLILVEISDFQLIDVQEAL